MNFEAGKQPLIMHITKLHFVAAAGVGEVDRLSQGVAARSYFNPYFRLRWECINTVKTIKAGIYTALAGYSRYQFIDINFSIIIGREPVYESSNYIFNLLNIIGGNPFF